MSKNIAIIFAGGSGTRMGSSIPKQFLYVKGKPVIIHTLEIFDSHPSIDQIYVACKKEYIEHLKDLVQTFSIQKIHTILPGGSTGQESIYLALCEVSKSHDAQTVVFLHDGVRPCISPSLIDAHVENMERYGSSVTCTPMVETPILSQDGRTVQKVLNRSRCYTAKAPQCFFLGDLLDAHEKIRKKNPEYKGIVDSCSLMRKLGKEVHILPGSKDNLKLTTPEDLKRFECYLEKKEAERFQGSYKDSVFWVSEIRFERILLHLKICTSQEIPTDFFLVSEKSKQRLALPYESYENGTYTFRCNLSTMNGRSFLENGSFKIVAVANEEVFGCGVSKQLVRCLEDHCRVYPYRHPFSYQVSFHVSDNELRLDSYFVAVHRHWKKRNLWKEGTCIREKLNSLLRMLFLFCIQGTYLFWCLFPIKKNSVLCLSMTKDSISSNLKRVTTFCPKPYDISYSCRNLVGKRSVLSWFAVVRAIANKEFIFVDDYVPVFSILKPRSRTKLIQLWHAGVGFKSVGYARFGKKGSPHPVLSCHRQYDFVLVDFEEHCPIYQEVFGIEESAILAFGLRRREMLSFRQDDDALKKTGKKWMLFAPTFRGVGQQDAYYPVEWLDFDLIYELCGENWIFGIKMHPFIKTNIVLEERYQNRIRICDGASELSDWYPNIDVLVTDYSSCYYDFLFFDKPVYFFTPDWLEYEVERGIQGNLAQRMRGKRCDSWKEVFQRLGV